VKSGVIVVVPVAAALLVSPAAATGSRHEQIGPRDRFRPRIVGSPRVGVTLRATRGIWISPRPVVYEYSWLRCRTGRVRCRRIAGATRSRYTPSRRDIGTTLQVIVTARNRAGSARASSRRTGVVKARAAPSTRPALRSPPTVSGRPQDGQTLAATTGSWTGTRPISYAYQWEGCDATGLDCSPIANAVDSTYAVTSAEVGATIRVFVTARNTAGATRASSAPTGVVESASAAPANTSPPTIFGSAEVGQSLTASPGAWSGTQPIIYAYQWQDCDATGDNCIAINGATSSAYAVTTVDAGTTIRVLVTASNIAGQAGVSSAATAVVQAASAPPANTSPPTISGSDQQGKPVTASPGTWTGTQPIDYAYQWQDCDPAGANCSPISGATAATYTPGATDVGSALEVTVTATNSAGSTAASSAATAVVVSSSVVALWHMDETIGDTMLDSVGTHTGTLYSVQLGLPGFTGTSYGFNGASYVDVPSSTDLDPGNADLTFTIHLQTTGTPPPAPDDWDLFRKGDYGSSGGEYKMELQSTGQASCGFQGSSDYDEIIAGPAINDGQWHTVSCVKNSTAIELVVDGTVYAKAATIGSISNTSDVTIGSHPGADWYQGQLDEASIQIG
jgi:hypothetical protein